MQFHHRNLLLLVALATAAGVSWYWSRDRTAPETLEQGGPSGPLGYYLREAEIEVMDADGRVLYEISADSVEERPSENRTVLNRVSVKYTPAADIPWEVSAETGEIPEDQRYIELTGAVELMSSPEPSRDRTIIQAPRLRFAPEAFLATTDSEVSLLLGEQRLEAVGLSADLKGDRLELESSVHGQFNP